MKFIKWLLFSFITLLIILSLFIFIVFKIEESKTSYLKLSDNPSLKINTYTIKNVNIIPMNVDTVFVKMNIEIVDGVIKRMSKELNGTEKNIIDAKGKYLTPGLIDMHIHLWDRFELGLYLANGVTTVRNLWGMPMHLRIKNEIDNDEMLSPLFITSSPKLTGAEFIGDDNLNLYSPDEAREKVIKYEEDGYDFIKSYYGLTRDIYDAIIDQAIKSNISIVAHPSQKVPFAYHFNPQIVSIEHAEDIVQEALNFQLDSVKLDQVVKDFSKSNISFCPTLMAFYNIYRMIKDEDILSTKSALMMNPLIQSTDSRDQFDRWQNSKANDSNIPIHIKKQHDFHLRIVKQFNDAGINIICGTDAGIGITVPGQSIHEELAFYKEAGLNNYDVLKTATINASKVHKQLNNLGSIEKGKIANLILTSDNPLENLTVLKHPEWVMVKGRIINKKYLNEFVINANERSNLLITALRYLEYLVIERSL
ncbi:MAG: amidohydrolase family protein [Ignavibacteriales bacterium]|nr:amidohydrolase family protein [Ignavibacteriales bacterium]